MNVLLKQRLVGAVVLVALAVIFIPMLLEGPDSNLVPEMAPLPEPGEPEVSQPLERFQQAGEMPEEPERSVIQESVEAPDVAQDGTDTEELPLPGENVTAPDETPEAPQASDAQPGAAAPSAASADDTTPASRLGNWVVQMGSFSSEPNALRLRDRLRKEHFATQVEKVVVGGKTHYRVQVGPYLERAEAEQDQQKLARSFDLKGRVLSYP
jgi:DedD protein